MLEVESREPRLSRDETERAVALANAAIRREWLAAHIALRLIIERAAGEEWRRRAFVRTPRGKPSLAGAPIDFSLSHAPGVALIAVSHIRGVGVDIECPRPLRFDAERRERIEDSATAIAGCDLSGEDDARTLQAWVRLEALAKADGCGMGRLLTRLGIMGVAPAVRSAPLSIPEDLLPRHRGGTSGRTLHDLYLGPGRFAAVAFTGTGRAHAPRSLPAWPEECLRADE